MKHRTGLPNTACRAGAIVFCAAGLLAAGNPAFAQRRDVLPDWSPVPPLPARGEVEVVPVKGNVYMIAGAGANITVQAGDDGLVLVDTGTAEMSEAVIEAIETIPAGGPLRYIINTTHELDYTGGNEAIVVTGEIVPLRGENYGAGPQGILDYNRASLISHLNVFTRMVVPESGEERPEGAWPDNTYSTPIKRLYFNDEPIVISHLPANNDGNSIVIFRRSDVVAVGPMLDLTRFPILDVEAGGSVNGYIDALNALISVVVPLANSGGGTLVVSGYGRIADHAEVVYYRDMVTVVRDRIRDMINRDMTLEEIQEAGPTRGYDALYGSDRGDWTTEMFVEAVYDSLVTQ